MTKVRSFRRKASSLRPLALRATVAAACVATTLLPTTSLVGDPLPARTQSRSARVASAVTAVTSPFVNGAISAVSRPVESVATVAQSAVPGSDALVASLAGQAPGLRPSVLRLALDAAQNASDRGLVRRDDLLTVIDYSLPSTQPRLFVFDLDSKRLLFRELVAHGKNTGDNYARHFSNRLNSLETSLGLFVTGNTYVGGNGYSLQLVGLEKGVNDLALKRSIVIHGAPYVNEGTARALGRIGRSWGCPALNQKIAPKVIDTVKGGSPVFAFYPDSGWLRNSQFLSASVVAQTQIASLN